MAWSEAIPASASPPNPPAAVFSPPLPMLPIKSPASLPTTAPAAPAKAGLIAPLNASFQDLPCIFAAATATAPATIAPVTPAATVPPPGKVTAIIGPTLLISPPITPPTRLRTMGCTAGLVTAFLTICIRPPLV